MITMQPFFTEKKSAVFRQENIAAFFTILFLFAAVVPGVKALGNIGWVGMAITRLWGLVQQGPKHVLRQTSMSVYLSLSLFAWIVWALANQPNTESWRAFFHHSALGKALLAGLFVTPALGSVRFVKVLSRLMVCLLLLMNIRQLYLMWHFHVLFHFADLPFTALWQIRDCGQYIILLLPFLFLALVSTPHRWQKIAYAVCLVAQLFLLLVTGLRGAYLGLMVAAGIWLWLSARWRWLIALLLGLGLFYTSVMLFFPNDNIVHQAFARGGNDSGRIALVWKPTLTMIGEAPLYGHGFGQKNFMDIYQRYQAHYPDWHFVNLPDPHNVGLSLGFAAGVPALFLYAFLLVGAVCLSWRQRARLKNASDDDISLFPLAVCCAWIALPGVLGQTDMIRWDYFSVLLVLTSVCHTLRRSA